MKTKKYRVNGKLKNQKPKGNLRKTSKNLTKLKCKKMKKQADRRTPGMWWRLQKKDKRKNSMKCVVLKKI